MDNKSHEQGTTVIHNNHSGPGNNIGVQNNYHQLTDAALRKPVQQILDNLRGHKLNEAEIALDALVTMTGKDHSAENLLMVLEHLVDIVNKEPNQRRCLRDLNGVLSDLNSEPYLKDLALTGLMRLSLLDEDPASARRQYVEQCQTEPHYAYAEELFLETLADKEELLTKYQQLSTYPQLQQLYGLVNGLIRLQLASQARDCANRISAQDDSHNATFFQVIADLLVWDQTLEMRTYFGLKASEKEVFDRLASQMADLIIATEAKDPRILSNAASLVQFSLGEHEYLESTCWQYVEQIEACDSAVGKGLRAARSGESHDPDSILGQLIRAKKDRVFKDKLVRKLKKTPSLPTDQAYLLSNLADKKTLVKWVEKGGTISAEGKLDRDFLLLEIRASTQDKSPLSAHTLRKLCENFLNEFKSELTNLHPVRTLELCDNLIACQLPEVARRFLTPLLPDEEYWPSPLVKCYLNALHDAQQHSTLQGVLAEIDQSLWDSDIWCSQAQHLMALEQLDPAASALDKALAITPDSLHLWYLRYLVAKLKKSPENDLRELLLRIPETVFQHSSHFGYCFMTEMICHGLFTQAEPHLLNWFLENPDKESLPFAQCFLGSIIHCKQVEKKIEPSPAVAGLREAVVCRTDKTQKIWLIPESEVGPDRFERCSQLLPDDSPFTSFLTSGAIHECQVVAGVDIEILERLPPYDGVLRIALDTISANSDGRGPIWPVQLEKTNDDPQAFREEFERKVKSLQFAGDTEPAPDVPLYMRTYNHDVGSVVKTVIRNLQDARVPKPPLPAMGDVMPASMVVDVYAASYLALCGLVHGLKKVDITLIMTQSTRQAINSFLETLTDKNYMGMSVTERGLHIHTAQDAQQYQFLTDGLQWLLDNADSVPPTRCDLPPDILMCRDALDQTVYSSLTLSLSNDIPWMAIDPMFAELAKKTGSKVVDVKMLTQLLSQPLSLDEKLTGIELNVYGGVEFPVMHQDLLQLSASESDDYRRLSLLAEILKKYPQGFNDLDDPFELLGDIAVMTYLAALKDGVFQQGFREMGNARNNGLAERVLFGIFGIAIQLPVKNNSAEEKLATLLGRIFNRLQKSEFHKLNLTKEVSVIASLFISGHFMSIQAINDVL